MDVVTHNHASAGPVSPTRGEGEQGIGTARRRETNFLPVRPISMRVISPMNPPRMGRAVEVRRGVLGRTGAVPVLAKSANNAPAQVGLNAPGNAWGIAGVGDAPAAEMPLWMKAGLLAGIAYLGMRAIRG